MTIIAVPPRAGVIWCLSRQSAWANEASVGWLISVSDSSASIVWSTTPAVWSSNQHKSVIRDICGLIQPVQGQILTLESETRHGQLGV